MCFKILRGNNIAALYWHPFKVKSKLVEAHTPPGVSSAPIYAKQLFSNSGITSEVTILP